MLTLTTASSAGALGPLRGYVYNVSIYGGKGDGADDDDGAKVNYVTRLLTEDLDFSGHVIVTDNYYTSEKLALALNNRGIGFVGTFDPKASSFEGFAKPEVGTYQSGDKQGETRHGPAIEPGKFRTAQRVLAPVEGANGSAPSSSRSARAAPATQRLSNTLTTASWCDSSKTKPVNLLSNFAEAEHDTCTRQPKAPTDENPECAREERDCPWIAKVYGKYYGGVDTADMDIGLSRFDHKSSVPERSRSYHRVW